MEARAKHDFIPQKSDELAFTKDSTLHVINMEEEPNWYRARFGDKEGLVPKNYLEMAPHHWFVPRCSRLEAEARLAEKDAQGNYIQPDGAFLLRPSENNPGQFSISVKEGVFVLHFRVFYEASGSYFIWTSKFSSINKLINHHRDSTIYGLRVLLLKDCVPSPTFGPIGAGSPYNGPQASIGNGVSHAPKAPSNIMMNQPTATSSNTHNARAPQMSSNSSRNQHAMHNAPEPQQPKLPFGLQPSSHTGQICMALYNFKPEFQEEMEFIQGDLIEITGEEDQNWWHGILLDPETRLPRNPPREGLFPSNYVRMLSKSGGHPQMPQQPIGGRILAK